LTAHAGVHEKGTYNLQTLMGTLKKNPAYPDTGSVALFIGVARNTDIEGKSVQKLTLEAYEEKANEVLEAICRDLLKRQGIIDVQIHHLLGEFEVGEDLVYVAVAGSHREETFSVLREAVERYKHDAPIFKKEQTINPDGSKAESWVSEKNIHSE
jgi:molybdopterin synthase catalytic subunit